MFEPIFCSVCKNRSAIYRSPLYGFEVCHECLRTTQLGLVELMGREFIDSMLESTSHNMLVELGIVLSNNRFHGQFNVAFNVSTGVVDRSQIHAIT